MASPACIPWCFLLSSCMVYSPKNSRKWRKKRRSQKRKEAFSHALVEAKNDRLYISSTEFRKHSTSKNIALKYCCVVHVVYITVHQWMQSKTCSYLSFRNDTAYMCTSVYKSSTKVFFGQWHGALWLIVFSSNMFGNFVYRTPVRLQLQYYKIACKCIAYTSSEKYITKTVYTVLNSRKVYCVII